MDALLVLLGLGVLALPIAVVALLVGQSRLKARVAGLEAGFAGVLARAAAPAATVQVESMTPAAAPPPVAVQPLAEPVAPLPADITGPWSTVVAPTAPAQMRPDRVAAGPVVFTADRMAALSGWLRENWAYAISALSLALAGVFFVQYGIDNGLLPPGLRVLAGMAFGTALIGAGEVLRRRLGDGEAAPTAYLPSVFSGAGLVSLFAAILAARQMYGLIGPELAFFGLVATATLAVVLGWRYGPLLAAIGLIGAAAAPFLVAGGTQASPWLYGHYALVAVVGLAVDAFRRWAWVSVLALVLGFAGGVAVWLTGGGLAGLVALQIVLPVLAAALPVLSAIPQHPGPMVSRALLQRAGWPTFPVRLVAGAVLAATTLLSLLSGATSPEGLLVQTALTVLSVALLIWGRRAPGLADLALVPAAGFLLRLVTAPFELTPVFTDFQAQAIALRPPESGGPMTVSVLLGLAALISAASAWRALTTRDDRILSIGFGLGAVLTAPVAAAVLELLWRPSAVIGAGVWAGQVMALAALMVALALRFARSDGDKRRFAHATLSALSLVALALFIGASATALTMALAVLVMTAAALDRRYALPEMGLFLQAGAAVLGYRLLVDPGLDWAMTGPLWQVIVAFAGVIGAFVVALLLLDALERPSTKAVAESAAVGLAAILANVLLSRWLTQGMTAGDGFAEISSHWAVTLNALPWLVVMFSQLYRARTGGRLRWLRLALAAVGAVVGLGGLATAVVVVNPLLTARWQMDIGEGLVGGPWVFDSLLLAYAVPGLMFLAGGLRLPGLPRWLEVFFQSLGAGLLALYAGLEIRRFWQGDWLGTPGVQQGELYTYTVALMILGATLLYQAIARRSPVLRRIGMAVIAVTVVKVFFIDASGLTGLTRVASFAGLGLSLAGLAWLNRWAGQRLES